MRSASGSMRPAIRAIADDIKIAHSVFALPFALLAAFMAAATNGSISWAPFSGQLALVALAMFFARTCAMLANRLLDRKIDAINPRTAGRAIPSGRLSASSARAALLLSSAMFLVVCAGFGVAFGNWWPSILGLPVLLWICSYGYFKRFTSLCHIWLGSSLAISPLAAAIAVHPDAIVSQPALWLLSVMVLCWVAGFDIIYALQDVDVDRQQGLHSVPARFGPANALRISRSLHTLAMGCLVASLLVDERFGPAFGVGIVLVGLLLIIEHATVSRWGTTKMSLTFFTLNGIISCILGGLGILDVLI